MKYWLQEFGFIAIEYSAVLSLERTKSKVVKKYMSNGSLLVWPISAILPAWKNRGVNITECLAFPGIPGCFPLHACHLSEWNMSPCVSTSTGKTLSERSFSHFPTMSLQNRSFKARLPFREKNVQNISRVVMDIVIPKQMQIRKNIKLINSEHNWIKTFISKSPSKDFLSTRLKMPQIFMVMTSRATPSRRKYWLSVQWLSDKH